MWAPAAELASKDLPFMRISRVEILGLSHIYHEFWQSFHSLTVSTEVILGAQERVYLQLEFALSQLN